MSNLTTDYVWKRKRRVESLTRWRQKGRIAKAIHSVNNGSLIQSPPRAPQAVRLAINKTFTMSQHIPYTLQFAVYTYMLLEKQNENYCQSSLVKEKTADDKRTMAS
ncbi:hypothetical protein ECA3919 [Pectobacterium atrosepticum SCRI1043]|uniref:Uncharacterized protein n=1 Tax=Pectobacterium atrosepticum (strain SCRI 1043 / ATCC BAA-672) TaxID=218491 RepID=Q6D082_PECAS|nr:hypothetical protein ECA3919 [Pectobacterium atrosepticum SCRI1043]